MAVGEALHLENYSILDAAPELSGSLASTLLKSDSLQAFFGRYRHIVGGYFHGPGHACNTNNVVGDLWSEFRKTMVFLRESGTRGLEPLSQEHIDMLDLSMRKQRVWLGYIAPADWALHATWHAWVHTLYFHMMWFVNKYKGVGSLTQEGIEDAHKETHKDVAAYTVGGTRLATDKDWIRVMRFYNIDLLTLMHQSKTRNGGNISRFFCQCKGGDVECALCKKRNPRLLLLT